MQHSRRKPSPYPPWETKILKIIFFSEGLWSWLSCLAYLHPLKQNYLFQATRGVSDKELRALLRLTLSFASMSHLAEMSISMMSVLPRDEAQCIGARPYCNNRSKQNLFQTCTVHVRSAAWRLHPTAATSPRRDYTEVRNDMGRGMQVFTGQETLGLCAAVFARCWTTHCSYCA
jgi:hypothetical protein